MEISGNTQVVGLIGWPVVHTFSPAMHNAAAQALGLDLVYIPLPVRPGAVGAAVEGLPALGMLGANVTIPHKQAVMPVLDEVTAAAQAIGAVNTIQVIGNPASAEGSSTSEQAGHNQSPISNPQSLLGDNTDWRGFLADLKAKEVPVGERACLILGAGGAARAVAYGLAQAGGRVEVSTRRPEQAHSLVATLAPHLSQGSLTTRPWVEREQIERGVLIVNTTPVGMHPLEAESPWSEGRSFPEECFVYDLIYNPAETRLMAQAQAAGCRTANGLGMLLHQGALAFEMWTGKRPDVEIMASALRKVAFG